METELLKLLSSDDFRIFQTIRIEKTFGSVRHSAIIAYNRNYRKSLDPDEYDNIILSAVRTKYPNAELKSEAIITEQDKRKYNILKPLAKDTVNIYLSPQLNDISQENCLYFSTVQLKQYIVKLPIFFYEEDKLYFCNEGYWLYHSIDEQNTMQFTADKLKSQLLDLDYEFV
jgi:hypothetical protein